jgi:tetratricopeptide (TPR) repeat protein
MKGRAAAIVMAVLLAVYLVLVGWQAVQFIATGEPVAIGIGIALIVLPILGAWALWRELDFGIRSQQLVRRLDAEGGADLDLPALPSGRVDRGVADAAFDDYRREAEQEPDSWRAWLRLGLAYDAAGDRRRARGAVRRAISLERGSR